jgi:hypothetical protein
MQRDGYHELWYEEAKKNATLQEQLKKVQDKLGLVHKIRGIAMSPSQPNMSTISTWSEAYFNTLKYIADITQEMV